MRGVIAFLIAAAVIIALAWGVSILPGTWSATINETQFQTTTPIALALFAAAFLVLYLVIRLLAALLSLPRVLRRGRSGSARARGDRAVTRTLVALAANDGDAARREADRTRRLLGDTPLTLLLAAQAGRQAGQEEEAADAFRLLAERGDAPFLGLRGLLRQAVAREDWAEADSLARRADAAYPGAQWLRDERRTLALRTSQWEEALKLSGPDDRATLALAAAGAAPNAEAGLRLAKQAYRADPSLAPAVVAYAARLREMGKSRKADDLMGRAWAAQPHPSIAAEYLRHHTGARDRVQAAARLANANPAHPESRLMQAQAALDAGLTADARKQIEAARASGFNQRRLWMLAADVAEHENDVAAGQDALRHAASANPDPVWRCGACGTVHGDWRPVCDACGTPGKVAWVEPDEHGTLLPPSGQRQFPRLAAAQDVEGIA